jgi:hypothetical protein
LSSHPLEMRIRIAKTVEAEMPGRYRTRWRSLGAFLFALIISQFFGFNFIPILPVLAAKYGVTVLTASYTVLVLSLSSDTLLQFRWCRHRSSRLPPFRSAWAGHHSYGAAAGHFRFGRLVNGEQSPQSGFEEPRLALGLWRLLGHLGWLLLAYGDSGCGLLAFYYVL